MHNRNKQQGYAVLFMLTGLSAVAVGFTFSGPSKSQWQALTQDAYQLNKERARLIHYAVDYTNLYGSGGAGPGHLPCPDSDEGVLRPGPNPPCGGSPVANGKLPDGVTREAGRIALTSSLLNRSSYSLSRAVVNNPSLAMSSHTWPQEQDFEPFGLGYALLTRPSGQYRTLTREQLARPILRWVRAWLVWQMLETPLRHCSKANGLHQPKPPANNTHLVGRCPGALNAEALSNTSPAPVIASCILENQLCELSMNSALNWLTEGEMEYWQDTPSANHWFIKNHWIELFQLQAHPLCFTRSVDCGLYYDEAEQLLVFRLFPLDIGEQDV